MVGLAEFICAVPPTHLLKNIGHPVITQPAGQVRRFSKTMGWVGSGRVWPGDCQNVTGRVRSGHDNSKQSPPDPTRPDRFDPAREQP